MASSGDILIKMAVDIAELKKGVADSKKELESIKGSADIVTGAIDKLKSAFSFAAVVAAIGTVVKSLVDYNTEVERTIAANMDLAKTFDVQYSKIIQLQTATREAGTTMGSLGTALTKIEGEMNSAALGNQKAADKFNDMGVAISYAGGKARESTDVLKDALTAWNKMPDGIEKNAIALRDYGMRASELKKVLEALNKEGSQNSVFDNNVKKMKENEAALAKSTEEWNLWWQNFITPKKLAALELLNDAIEGVGKALEWASGKASAFFDIFTKGIPSFQSEHLKTAFAELPGLYEAFERETNELMKKRRADAISGREQTLSRAGMALPQNPITQRINSAIGLPDAPPPVRLSPPSQYVGDIDKEIRGWSSSSPTKTGGGGGGRGEEERFEMIIERLKRDKEAADRATKELLSSADRPLADLEKAANTQLKIDEMVTRILTKYPTQSKGREDEVRKYAEEMVKAQENVKEWEKYAKQAETTEKQWGDGTKEHARAVSELRKQYETGRLSVEAFNHAMKGLDRSTAEIKENFEREEGGIGAFRAGIERSMRGFERANDMFSMGEKAANGFFDTLGKGFDDVSNNAGKNLGKIAQDFAMMLAKMALQAALSPVFKYLGSSIMNMFSLGTGGGPQLGLEAGGNPFSGATFSATGADALAGRPYWVGEAGPERFVPNVGGRIEPAGSRKQMGDVNITVNNGDGNGPDARASLDLAKKLKMAVTDVIRNERRPGGLLYGGT
jgi:hypothetical protein